MPGRSEWRRCRAQQGTCQRQLADGSTESVERQRKPAIEPLLQGLDRVTAPGDEGMENLRENAVLGDEARDGVLTSGPAP